MGIESSTPLNLDSRLHLDSREVMRIQRSGRMSSEQGSGFLQQFGGPSNYITTTKLTKPQRLVFMGVQKGLGDEASLAMETGLEEGTVSKAIEDLKNKGLVKVTVEKK